MEKLLGWDKPSSWTFRIKFCELPTNTSCGGVGKDGDIQAWRGTGFVKLQHNKWEVEIFLPADFKLPAESHLSDCFYKFLHAAAAQDKSHLLLQELLAHIMVPACEGAAAEARRELRQGLVDKLNGFLDLIGWRP